MLDDATKSALQALGWYLSDEGWAAVCEGILEPGDHRNPRLLHEAALDTDIRKRGVSRLPAEIRSVSALTIDGPLICQISEILDISRPLKVPGSSSVPVHTCQLSDGSTTVTAVELHANVKQFSPSTPPGTKVRLRGARVRCGVLLADDATFEVLGGKVQHLVDAWEAQAKYGGLVRVSRRSIANMGPAFSLFDPTRNPKGSRQVRESRDARPALQQLPGHYGAMHDGDARVPPVDTQGQAAMREGARQSEVAPSSSGAGPEVSGERNSANVVGSRASEAGVQAAESVKNAELVRQKLQKKFRGEVTDLVQRTDSHGRGRGRRKGGRGRRGGFTESDGPAMMTLDAWETSQRAPSGAAVQGVSCSDEELARQLQEQFDLEERAASQQPGHQGADTSGFFAPSNAGMDNDGGGRHGKGKGRGRGRGRGHGRGLHFRG